MINGVGMIDKCLPLRNNSHVPSIFHLLLCHHNQKSVTAPSVQRLMYYVKLNVKKGILAILNVW